MLKYRTFPTTADLGLFVYGESPKEVFENLAYALRRIIGGRKTLRPSGKETLTLKYPDLETGLFLWSSELLFLYDSRGVLPLKTKILKLQPRALKAEVNLGKLQGPPQIYIKAITMHRLQLRKIRGRWRASLVLDL